MNESILCGSSATESHRHIYSPTDLTQVAKNPNATYILMADLDMTGEEWIPIENFSGSFDGNGKTISNLTVTVTANGSANMGMFGSIAKAGVVRSLHLQNITLNASETIAKNIGTVAGVVEGKLEQCSAMGYIYDNRNADPAVVIGALVGRAETGATILVADTVTSTDDANTYTTTGLAADVALPVSYVQNNTPGLVGVNAEGNQQILGIWRDRSYGSHRLSEDMRQRQKTAVDAVYKTGSIKWTTPVTLTHTSKNASIHEQIFEPGVVHQGIPYDHTGGSYQRFMHVLDENNQVREDFAKKYATSFWGGGDNLQTLGFTAYMGSDCSSGVGWGWHQISPAQVADIDGEYQGGMCPYLTSSMIPDPDRQEAFGIYPVGEWTGAAYDPDKAAYKVVDCDSTTTIIELNGDQVIYEAYGKGRKADAIVSVKPGGHIRIYAEDPVVIRTADGTLDPERSYLVTHEQGDGLFNKLYLGTNSSWRLNYRYIFRVLLKGSTLTDAHQRRLERGSGPNYIPITIRALRDEKVKEMEIYTYPAGQDTAQIVSPVEGVFGSNYRIQAGTVIIKDQTGKEVYNKEVFDCFEGNFALSRGAGLTYDLSHFHGNALEGLPSGNYTFTIQALMGNGEYRTVVENQGFSI